MVADIFLGKDGSIVMVEGAGADTDRELVWVDRKGGEEEFESTSPERPDYPDFSPEGNRLVVTGHEGEEANSWVIDLSRGVAQRLPGTSASRPTWTPDGRSVTFTFRGLGSPEIWTVRADGVGDAEVLVDLDRNVADAVWSPDGAWLIYRTTRFQDDPGDIMGWQVGRDTPPVPLVATEFQELAPALAPNGRFLAYSSNRSGRHEIYVQPFPRVEEGMWPISNEGGVEPIWAKDGKELFYRRGESGDMVAVQVTTEGPFQIGEEQVLFPAGRYVANAMHPCYDVSRDGQRFVMLRRPAQAEDTAPPRLIMVQNFFTELEERTGRRR